MSIKTRIILYTTVLVIAMIYLWHWRHTSDKKIDSRIDNHALAPNEREKIIVDSKHHRIEVITPKSDKRSFLPDSNVAIDVMKNGTVTISARTLGTEVRPYVGGVLDQDIKPHAALGLDLFYVYRINFGGGILLDSSIRDTRIYVAATYNIVDNTSVGFTFDNRKTVGLLATLRF